jgi:hypothetical protein
MGKETGAAPPASASDMAAEMGGGCLSSFPPSYSYSTLVSHFYCWHPSYQYVSPNVRGCFTQISRRSIPEFDLTKSPPAPVPGLSLQKHMPGQPDTPLDYYSDLFDYCMYEPFDPLVLAKRTGIAPPYNLAMINANRAKGNKVGVLKFMPDDKAEIFRYVMFTWYNPRAFKLTGPNSQQEALDIFYNKDGKHPENDWHKAALYSSGMPDVAAEISGRNMDPALKGIVENYGTRPDTLDKDGLPGKGLWTP